MSKQLKLTFCGGVSTVTGANFLLESDKTKIVIDCGLEQGNKSSEERNRKNFIFDPVKIDFLLITHAHLDHIGRIPLLIKKGFKGIIYSTAETKEIAQPMLEDSVRLLAQEATRDGLDPIYDEKDVANCFAHWQTIPYHEKFKLTDEFTLYLKDAGHVLGSCMYEISYNTKKIVFTGDLGNTPTPLLRDTEDLSDANYVVMESVYGDRNHEPMEERRNKLEDVIEDVIRQNGVLMIPSFSLEKTQVIIYELNRLIEEGRVMHIPVFIDSPLAIKVTDIYRKHQNEFNEMAQQFMGKDRDLFNFKGIRFTSTSEESKAIKYTPNPKIIIAGSGMSNGGRITHHELNYLPDPQSTLLLIGYQSVGTLGRQLLEGAKSISMYGQTAQVKAKVVSIDGYSSHKDSDHLISFVEKSIDTLEKVFVVMGETKSSTFLVQRLRDYLGINAYHPEEGSSVMLDF